MKPSRAPAVSGRHTLFGWDTRRLARRRATAEVYRSPYRGVNAGGRTQDAAATCTAGFTGTPGPIVEHTVMERT
jgi:hypothetical protein